MRKIISVCIVVLVIVLIGTLGYISYDIGYSDEYIGEQNSTEEVISYINPLLVNKTILPSIVESIPKHKIVNASPIVMYSVESFSWVWVDNVSALPNKSTYQKRLINISKLEKDIEEAPYQIWELKRDSFDCSNTAGIMVEHLDSRGWDTAIVVGDSKMSTSIHVFVVVDRRIIVEPTLKVITYAEGKKDNMRDLNFYVNRWDIIGFYFSKEDAIKRSRWSYNEWDDWRI